MKPLKPYKPKGWVKARPDKRRTDEVLIERASKRLKSSPPEKRTTLAYTRYQDKLIVGSARRCHDGVEVQKVLLINFVTSAQDLMLVGRAYSPPMQMPASLPAEYYH